MATRPAARTARAPRAGPRRPPAAASPGGAVVRGRARVHPRSNGSWAAAAASSASSAAKAFSSSPSAARTIARARGRVTSIHSLGKTRPRSSSRASALPGALDLAESDERLDVERLAPIRHEVSDAGVLGAAIHPRQRRIDGGVLVIRELHEREGGEEERLPERSALSAALRRSAAAASCAPVRSGHVPRRRRTVGGRASSTDPGARAERSRCRSPRRAARPGPTVRRGTQRNRGAPGAPPPTHPHPGRGTTRLPPHAGCATASKSSIEWK